MKYTKNGQEVEVVGRIKKGIVVKYVISLGEDDSQVLYDVVDKVYSTNPVLEEQRRLEALIDSERQILASFSKIKGLETLELALLGRIKGIRIKSSGKVYHAHSLGALFRLQLTFFPTGGDYIWMLSNGTESVEVEIC